MKKFTYLAVAALMGCMELSAQSPLLKGVAENNRYDDGDQMVNKSSYVGFLSASEDPAGVGVAIFNSKYGVYELNMESTPISTTHTPNIALSEWYSGGKFTDVDKALQVNGWTKMTGNSGAVYLNGKIYTVFSRDEQSSEPEDMFIVRRWDAATGKMEKEFPHYSESKILESAGMAYNPIDKRVYGLFYVASTQLPESITSDPEYFTDEDDRDFGREGMDAGYAIGVLDTETMEVKIITPGLYYYNFVTFAINSEGRAFALTSGGVSAPVDADGRMRDINNNLTGAQLYEFDLTTGLIYMNTVQLTDPETGEQYTEQVPPLEATGYASQYRRQSACFAKSNPNKMYWNGYFNSGKGTNGSGSYTSLPDREWKTNGKYDTCLYEVDVNTGIGTRLGKIKDRFTFSCMWFEGDDVSDGQEIVNGIETVKAETVKADNAVYNLNGQRVSNPAKGLFITNGRKFVVK